MLLSAAHVQSLPFHLTTSPEEQLRFDKASESPLAISAGIPVMFAHAGVSVSEAVNNVLPFIDEPLAKSMLLLVT